MTSFELRIGSRSIACRVRRDFCRMWSSAHGELPLRSANATFHEHRRLQRRHARRSRPEKSSEPCAIHCDITARLKDGSVASACPRGGWGLADAGSALRASSTRSIARGRCAAAMPPPEADTKPRSVRAPKFRTLEERRSCISRARAVFSAGCGSRLTPCQEMPSGRAVRNAVAPGAVAFAAPLAPHALAVPIALEPQIRACPSLRPRGRPEPPELRAPKLRTATDS
jgi:hypothetical protein